MRGPITRFAVDHPDHIAEFNLNPLIIHPQGHDLTIIDALIAKRQATNS